MPTTTQATPASSPNTALLMQLADRVARLTPETIIGRVGTLTDLVGEARHAMGYGATPGTEAAQARAARLVELTASSRPTQALAEILGIPCFACIPYARALRAGGWDIATKAEAEQAATIHFFLGHYVEHGTEWWNVARKELADMVEAAKTKMTAAGESA